MLADHTLEVYAAASLREAFTTLARVFEVSHPGTTVHLNFAGSQALAAQIAQGAPADLFASADARNLDKIAYDPKTRRVFATNRLTIVSSGRKFDLKTLPTAARIVLASPAVPAGGYAREALETASKKKYGTAWLEKVNAHVVSEEADVRSVLAKVKLGEADAGIVYVSDVVSAGGGLRVSLLPQDVQPRIEYPAAVVKDAHEPLLARRFIDLLVSKKGRRALAARGFRP